MLLPRLLTALVLIPLILALLWWAPLWGWLGFAGIVLLLAGREWCRLAGFSYRRALFFLIPLALIVAADIVLLRLGDTTATENPVHSSTQSISLGSIQEPPPGFSPEEASLEETPHTRSVENRVYAAPPETEVAGDDDLPRQASQAQAAALPDPVSDRWSGWAVALDLLFPWLAQGVSVLAALFWLLLAPFYLRRHWRVARLASPLGWVVLLGAFFSLASWDTLAAVAGVNHFWVLLPLLAVTWVADSSAYLTGRLWGAHKLAPRISPGKSWEGVVGALAGVALYVLILWFVQVPYWSRYAPWALILLAWIMVAVSIVGDLFESLQKRQIGLKDSGHLLPGHGGVLDRIDSLLAVLPVSWLLYQLQFQLRLMM